MKRILVSLGLVLVAVTARAAEVSYTIPGPNKPETGVPGIVGNIYEFALSIAGLLAFGAVVYGAIKYTASAGNPTLQSDAKDMIYQAFLGILLLLGAGLILTTINPAILRRVGNGNGFAIPGLPGLEPAQPPSVQTCRGTVFGSCDVGECVEDSATGYFTCVATAGCPEGQTRPHKVLRNVRNEGPLCFSEDTCGVSGC